MAEEQTNAVSAPFPAPPPFYKHFTPENIERLELQRAADGSADAAQVKKEDDANSKAAEDELRFLVPPEPPANGKWSAFGIEYGLETHIRSLEENNIPRLYPAEPDTGSTSTAPRQNHTQLVIHVVRSILLNFLELADILSKDPSMAAEKIGDIRTLFYNAHHLLNEYRPHQARETLIAMMEEKINSMTAGIRDVKSMEDKVGEMLGGVGEPGDDQVGPADAERQHLEQLEQDRINAARDMWSALHSLEP